MSTSTIDTSGLDRLRARLAKVANPNPVPVLETISDIMDDDNRRGILAGEDGNGNPMVMPSYRPVGKKGVRLTVEQRLGQTGRVKRGRYAAFGSSAEGLFNNLSSSSYRKLDGPPLAPRRQFSRVITNYATRYGEVRTNVWEVIGAWINVLSRKGVPFLHFHFEGAGRLLIRDLRGIRPWGMDKIRGAIRAWMVDQVRNNP
jgi:hypothetical protein